MSVIIQHVYTDPLAVDYSNDMTDMMRLCYQRHAAYAHAFKFEYWHLLGGWRAKQFPLEDGGWCKVALIQEALEQGHEDVIWIDADAAIEDFDIDLRTALTYGKIGAVLHDAAWFREPQWQIPVHYNVGVLYARQGAQPFLTDWMARKVPELRTKKRWAEQGEFNEMVQTGQYVGLFEPLDAKWNATINVNQVEKPVVMGWHGVMPMGRRIAMMKSVMAADHLIYRVV